MVASELVRSCLTPASPAARVEAVPAGLERASSRPVWLDAAAQLRVFERVPGTLYGPRIAARSQLGHVAVGADAGVLYGHARDPLGTIDARVATVGASVLATARIWGVSCAIGPRGEIGVAWLQGHKATPSITESAARSTLAFVGVTGTAVLRIAGPLGVVIGVDGGTSIRGITALADQRGVFSLDGPSISGRLGIAWLAGY
jgi:hypothetical protein